MMLRALIVDDEPLALELLESLLAEVGGVEVVERCQNGREAVQYLKTNRVDLLFLDVEMPGIGGFDVVEQVGIAQLPAIVFVTAYQEHAVRAFDIHAVDYLTKPVSPQRLGMALDRVREKIASKTALLTQEQFAAVLSGLQTSASDKSLYLSRFLVKTGDKEILLPVERIDWIEADEYYCRLHADGHGYMVREPIGDLENKLDPKQFLRIHRSAIVSVSRVREIYREGISDASVVLHNGKVLKMSKSGRAKLNDLIRI
jgi:two-component system, LytTR family, response regulator